MKTRLIFFIVFAGFNALSQIRFETTKHDFGDLEPYEDHFVDIVVKNVGLKKEYLLSVKKPYDVVYIVNGQFIDPDSSIILRLQVNPKAKGRFNYEVEIFTSDKNEATQVKLSGNNTELPQDNLSAFTSCPDFSLRPGGKANKFDLTVVTVDKETRKPLDRSAVTMIQNGQPIWANETDKNGTIKKTSTLGLSYFYALHDGYLPAELGAYVNFQRNYVILELVKNPIIEKPLPKPVEPEIAQNDTVVELVLVEEVEQNLENQLNNETTTAVENSSIPIELAQLDKNNFDEAYFKSINVVFVLDVSASMKQVDKIELMKFSLLQLTQMLRKEDKMGIVTYATEAMVLLPVTSGSEKETINEEVAALKASGLTAGGAGIKLGYKQCLKGYLDDGVNQIIVITDGAFNRSSDDYKKFIKKYKRKGIQMSVVGIKNKPMDEDEMKEAAELGGGRYIPIFKLADAQNNLKEEIRFVTFKK
jgi:Ca-activated chloride channel family protein